MLISNELLSRKQDADVLGFSGKLISPKETAEILGVTEGTLSVWRCTNRYDLPFVKIGSKVGDFRHFTNARLLLR